MHTDYSFQGTAYVLVCMPVPCLPCHLLKAGPGQLQIAHIYWTIITSPPFSAAILRSKCQRSRSYVLTGDEKKVIVASMDTFASAEMMYNPFHSAHTYVSATMSATEIPSFGDDRMWNRVSIILYNQYLLRPDGASVYIHCMQIVCQNCAEQKLF